LRVQTYLTRKALETRFGHLRQINTSVNSPTYSGVLFPVEKHMLKAVICQGDPTSHGGKVLEGNPLVTTNGRAVAQRGHMTICPQCKGSYPIVEGLDFHNYAGIGTAVDGMQTACGAKLIATQRQMLIDDGGGSGSGSGGSKSAVAEQATAGNPANAQHSGAFRAVDEKTGQAIAGLPYRIELPDGRTLRGVTDDDGHTQRVTSAHPDTVKLYWETEDRDD
jgi:uncharacterized Zn-binding protein involved in type VI secretion